MNEYPKSGANESLIQNEPQSIVIVKQETKITSNKPVLSVVDILLSIFVVTPLVVSAWRGTWGLMDVHSQYFPLFPSFVAGIFFHIIFAICQDNLHITIVEVEKHWTLKIISHFIRRFYTYIFLLVTILHWRGGWGLLDHYLNIQFTENMIIKKEGIFWMLLTWTACFTTLLFTRGLTNASAPPFAICLDKGNFVFRFPTMFKDKTGSSITLHTLDCMFSVGVIGNFVVVFWRGMWAIVDITLLPDDYIWSSWVSLILGILLVGLVYRLQTCMKNLCARSKGVTKIILADFYTLLSLFATIFVWRGAWLLMCIYITPNDIELSCIVTHLVGFLSLAVLGCSNSMLVRGIYKDGKGSDGECVVFPCKFLQIILEQESLSECDNTDNKYKQVLSESNFRNDINGDIKV